MLLVLGELMGGDQSDGSPSRKAIPLIAGAIVLAQLTMACATIAGDKFTHLGVGRKPLFMAGLLTLPVRCALIIYWRDKGDSFLLSTQILDGLGGGFFGLVHPYLVADITFGTGRFNVLSKYQFPSIWTSRMGNHFLDDSIFLSFCHFCHWMWQKPSGFNRLYVWLRCYFVQLFGATNGGKVWTCGKFIRFFDHLVRSYFDIWRSHAGDVGRTRG